MEAPAGIARSGVRPLTVFLFPLLLMHRRISFRWLVLALASLGFGWSLFATETPPPVTNERPHLAALNRDLWTPFRESYRDTDADRYIALHHPDFIRAVGSNRSVSSLEDYAARVRKNFAAWRERGVTIDIQFRFFERIANEHFASERGIYRLTFVDNDGRVQHHYGQFHAFARQPEGRWRFVIDYDSNEGGTIDEARFLAASAVDDFRPF